MTHKEKAFLKIKYPRLLIQPAVFAFKEEIIQENY